MLYQYLWIDQSDMWYMLHCPAVMPRWLISIHNFQHVYKLVNWTVPSCLSVMRKLGKQHRSFIWKTNTRFILFFQWSKKAQLHYTMVFLSAKGAVIIPQKSKSIFYIGKTLSSDQ